MSTYRRNGLRTAMVVMLLFGWAALPAMAVDDLSLNVTAGSESVGPGDTVTVTLEVANLSAPINGVQALIRYDDTLLTLVGVTPTYLELILPAEGWIEVALSDDFGDIDYAAVINGSSTIETGTVATLTFTAIGEGVTSVTFRPDADPFFTKLTNAINNSTVLPSKIDSGTITSTCDDGLFCNGQETFVGGSCQAGTPPDCSVLTDQCNDGVCNEVADVCEAQPVNEGGTCDDDDPCTENDVCTTGICAGTAVDCSAFDDPCNIGTCNPATGMCEATPANEGGSCDDGIFCNGTDTCSGGVCISSGDPCTPLMCDEINDTCVAPIHVTGLEVFYAGKFGDEVDPGKSFLAVGSTATLDNVTNYMRGITGVRVLFDNIVVFTTTPDAAFAFEWTTGTGTTFSPVTNAATSISITPTVEVDVTVVSIVLDNDHARRRWLKVTIDSTQVTASGVELDGEMTGNPVVLPSGDGTPGGDTVFFLGNLTGDVDGDRKTLLSDIGLIRGEVNPFLSMPITNVYDVDKDGKVLLTDVGDARLDVNPFFTLPLITP